MAPKIKYTIKELRKPDKFREFVAELLEKSSNNFNKILYYVAGIIVVLIILFLITSYNERKSQRAYKSFENAITQYNEGQIPEAQESFSKLISEYPNGKSSKLAQYYSGVINFDIGEYEKSIEQLKSFISKASSYELLKDSANLTIGLSYFNLQNWQEAVEYLSKLINSGSPYEKQAKIHLGLSYEKLGQYDKAEEIYKNFLITNTNTPNNAIQSLPPDVGITNPNN